MTSAESANVDKREKRYAMMKGALLGFAIDAALRIYEALL